jgi:hypothetical protein
MNTPTPPVAELPVPVTMDTGGLGGHPRGLTTLFFTEMWERFSFYGMRALLIIFMTKSAAEGGLAFPDKQAAGIYGTYTMSGYLLSILGGFIADNFIGARRAVLCGGIIIACGHFAMALDSLPTFFAGLALVAIGTGLLKPNVSSMVGGLYRPEDQRRDAGFSIFYMGINLGAFHRAAGHRLPRPERRLEGPARRLGPGPAAQLALGLCRRRRGHDARARHVRPARGNGWPTWATSPTPRPAIAALGLGWPWWRSARSP